MSFCFERQISETIETARCYAARTIEGRQIRRPPSAIRTVQVLSIYNRDVAQVREVSDRHLRLKMAMQVNPGDRLTIELADDISVAGEVVWYGNFDCGVELDEPIDYDTPVYDLASDVRQLRVQLQCNPRRFPCRISKIFINRQRREIRIAV